MSSYSSLRKSWGREIVRQDIPTAPNLVFLILLILTTLAVVVPFLPAMPSEGLDPSWQFGINQALAQGLVLGRDIVFTFGPYASIYTRVYHPATDHLMFWGAMYFAVSFILVAYINYKSSHWFLKLGFLALLSTIVHTMDSLLFYYALSVGVCLHKAIISRAIDQLSKRALVTTLLLLFAPFGLLPLIKGSALAAVVATAAFSAFMLVKEQRRDLAVIVWFVVLISMSLFWIIADQPISALPSYLKSMFPITSGYTEAMAINGDGAEPLFYMGASILTCYLLFHAGDGPIRHRAAISLLVLFVLLLSSKAAFVRHDFHALIGSTMILLVAVLVSTLVPQRSVWALMLVSVMAWGYIDAAHLKSSTRSFIYTTRSIFGNAWSGLSLRVLAPGELENFFDRRISEIKKRSPFPKMEGTVDIYSFDQSGLIASGNSWNPRPVFQSYSAYTPELAEKNKRHLAGESGPDSVIFKIQPIDGRLPALEDGASWPILLSNYEPASFSNSHLVLKKGRAAKFSLDKAEILQQREYSFGEKINLPETDGAIYAKIHLKKTFLGEVLNLIYKPSELKIRFVMEGGVEREYRMIANMADSGFVVSPLVEATEEFGLLFAGPGVLREKKVSSITIEEGGSPVFWRNGFEVQFSLIDLKERKNIASLFSLSKPLDSPWFAQKVASQHCEGGIDYANGNVISQGQLRVASILNVSGWVSPSVKTADIPDKVYVVLTASGGERSLIEAKSTHRPDVAAYYGNPLLSGLGYAAAADISALEGDYILGLAYSKGGALYMCSNFSIRTYVIRA